MRKYDTPEMEIILMNNDVIITSVGGDESETHTPEVEG